MEGIYWLIPVGIVLIGALVQTFKVAPSFFDKNFDFTATKLTIAAVLLGASIVFLLFFLKARNQLNREGFQTKTAMDSWKELVDTYQLRQLCELKKRVEDKAFLSIKGSPPDQLTDVQARERTDKLFNEGTSQGSMNCALFNKTIEAKDIDTFFVAIQELPSGFLIQSYDTAVLIRNLLKEQLQKLKESLAEQEKMMKSGTVVGEGFIDPSVGICSAEIVQERRKFLRQKKLDEAAQRCLLPEEVPFESKDKIAENYIKKLLNTYLNYMQFPPGRPTMDSLLRESLNIEAELNKAQDDAQSGKLIGKA